MIRAKNLSELEKRGATLCGNDDLVFVQCNNCRRQYLYNQETLTIHTDPKDLAVSELNIDGYGRPCKGCGDPSWDFNEIPNDEIKKIEHGQWSWAL